MTMTTTTVKYTTSGAAGAEIDRRAERHMADHGCGYREAWHAVLAADPGWRQPTRCRRGLQLRPQPAVPVAAADEREIREWLLRALRDNMDGSLPGALGSLALEAAEFKKIGMPIEEAARRAMDGNPHLVTMAKLLLADVRRNAPENTQVPADKATAAGLAQGMPAGEVVHSRAQALIAEHPGLDYHEAMGAVLAADPGLKARYAGVQ